MRIPKSVPYALVMALPRTAVSYAGYVAAPVFMINWLAKRSYGRAFVLLVFLAIAVVVNVAMGLSFAFTSFGLELALLLPFIAAVLGFMPSKHLNGRSFIKVLNVLVFITSFISLIQMGFPFQLPYIHYLPDFFNGGFGNGGAKIVTVIGFFGIAEALSRKRGYSLRNNATLIISALNFLIPNFILGIVAGALALAIYVRRNRALVFAGAVAAMAVVPYLQFRAETKNDAFSEYYGTNPKIYAFVSVGRLYAEQPHTVLVGSGLGQFSSQPAIWSSPINTWMGSHNLPQLPGMFSADVHNRYVAPMLVRFKNNRFAIESSANKPYSGITQMLAELGLPLTVLLLYSAYLLFWRNGRGDFGKAAFLFLIGMNLLDPQIDSPWFGVMLFATLQALAADRRAKAAEEANRPRESGVFLPAPARLATGTGADA